MRRRLDRLRAVEENRLGLFDRRARSVRLRDAAYHRARKRIEACRKHGLPTRCPCGKLRAHGQKPQGCWAAKGKLIAALPGQWRRCSKTFCALAIARDEKVWTLLNRRVARLGRRHERAFRRRNRLLAGLSETDLAELGLASCCGVGDAAELLKMRRGLCFIRALHE